MDEKLPVKSDQPDEDKAWKDIAAQWKEIGKQVVDLGDRLGTAFKEGWDTETVSEEEAKRFRDKLRELGEKMEGAADKVVEEAKAPETKAHAKETMEATKAASADLFGELRESLSEGLQEANKRVDELVQKRKQKKEEGEQTEEE
jgi:hypothetical protein